MKKKIIIYFYCLLAGVTLITSCKKEEILPVNKNPNSTAQQNDGMIILGEQLNDPYSIENMKKAYSNLRTRGDAPDINITPTHTYLRLLPKDETEWGILKSDTAIQIYDYPLNFEIQNIGTYYHDPSLPDSSITWQYCVLPIDYAIPNIHHEKIYDVFIPEETDSTRLKSGINLNEFYADLELESVKLSGNLPEGGTRTEKASKWTPKGKIRVYDDYLGWVPVVGANVHARWFTRVESNLTDGSGNFTMPQFRYEVNYAIKWDRRDFDIREGNWGQAWYNGPKQKGDWNLDIGQGGMNWVYAHIHRGAYTYYYANNFGVKSPPLDGKVFKQKIHIGAMNKSGTSHYYDFNKFWLSPQIKVYAKTTNGSWLTGINLFGTSVHELAHASHWEIGYSYGQYVVDAIFSEPFLPESWAQGVEAYITSKIYGDSPKYEWDQDKYLSSILGNGGYTPIVWDLMDDYNQKIEENVLCPVDNVKGYTLNQLESALYTNYTWKNWKNAIKSNFDNPTENKLDELFGQYK
jgi:hypothetical protein